MSPHRAILTSLRKFARFGGRASRAEYWWFVLALVIGQLVAGMADDLLFPADPERGLADRHPVTVFFIIVTLLPLFSAGVRRLHDVNRRGWWILLPAALPLALTLISFALLLGLSKPLEEVATFSNTGPQIIAVVTVAALSGVGSAIYLIVLLARAGGGKPNRFGPPPEA